MTMLAKECLQAILDEIDATERNRAISRADLVEILEEIEGHCQIVRESLRGGGGSDGE